MHQLTITALTTYNYNAVISSRLIQKYEILLIQIPKLSALLYMYVYIYFHYMVHSYVCNCEKI